MNADNLKTDQRTDTRQPFVWLLLIIVLSPWPLGSNRDWAWPLITIIAGVAAIQTLIIRSPRLQSNEARLGLAAFIALLAWIIVQWFGIPGILDPITVDRYQTRSEWLKTLTYGCFFFCLLQSVTSHDRCRLLIGALLLVGLAQALLGGAQQLVYDMPRARGSFANPNHYAGYLQACIALAIGLIMALQGDLRDQSGARRGGILLGVFGRLRLILIILVIALIMSRSRMGNLAFLAGILGATAIAYLVTRRLNRFTAVFLISILVIDIFLAGSYFGLDRLGERWSNARQQVSMRVDLQGYNLQIFRDHLLAGTGAGGYETAFTPYRDAQVSLKATHAENDILELLVELGLVGCIPLLIILAAGITAQLRGLRHPDIFVRGIAFGCLTGTLSLLVHGIAEVNLQIPSNSLAFTLLLALPIALMMNQERGGETSP